MPGVARVNADSAGGLISGHQCTTVFANGNNLAVKGDSVVSHGLGVHIAPVMIGASATVYAQGKQVCRAGDSASCGHAASGSSTVFAGG